MSKSEIILRVVILVLAALLLTLLDWIFDKFHVDRTWSVAITFWVGYTFNAIFFTSSSQSAKGVEQ